MPFGRLPYLDDECDCVWSDEQLDKAFRESRPLLTHYQDCERLPTSSRCSANS
jgi:hypothetical protein